MHATHTPNVPHDRPLKHRKRGNLAIGAGRIINRQQGRPMPKFTTTPTKPKRLAQPQPGRTKPAGAGRAEPKHRTGHKTSNHRFEFYNHPSLGKFRPGISPQGEQTEQNAAPQNKPQTKERKRTNLTQQAEQTSQGNAASSCPRAPTSPPPRHGWTTRS